MKRANENAGGLEEPAGAKIKQASANHTLNAKGMHALIQRMPDGTEYVHSIVATAAEAVLRAIRLREFGLEIRAEPARSTDVVGMRRRSQS